MIAEDKIIQLINRFQFLEAKMSGDVAGSDIAALAKEYSDLRPVVETVTAYKDLVTQIAEAEAMMSDPEMKELAAMELPDLKAQIAGSEHAVQLALLPDQACLKGLQLSVIGSASMF